MNPVVFAGMRNFPKLQLLFFFYSSKKTQLSVGGGYAGKFRDKSRNGHVNKQEGYTSILIDLCANTPVHPLRDYRIKHNCH